ncbi:putative thiazole-containing bacteriocin maturation protein [Paenibacillus chartarius]|uniref:Thiazole-containing bacteriocin maturation protein n=1 Tax=Paenibacillus chartarius TaxID=747481 RepID=A0ABV6DT00_9BACL
MGLETYVGCKWNESCSASPNVGTFRMQGEMIDRWIEKLIPMFNGENTMEALTNGLSEPYIRRVYEIAEALYGKGFLRDMSQDRPHRLTEGIVRKYAPQIAFLDSFADSGAFRFQQYRQAEVLVAGSGPILAALAAALLESGLPRFHVLLMDSAPSHKRRLAELEAHARQSDPEVEVKEVTLQRDGASGWRELVQPYQAVLYASEKGDARELRLLNSVCKEERKLLLPAVCLHHTGMAGPLVHPESDACWESAWRRIHRVALEKDPQRHAMSSASGAMLANVLAFELLKSVTGVIEPELRDAVYLLDLETLEGSIHPVSPHPLASGDLRGAEAAAVKDWGAQLERDSGRGVSTGLFAYLNRLTSAHTGILHLWEEGDLKQLPLSQCSVQAVDPLTEGPAGLLPDLVCSGLTHEEARREAGLCGIEAYASRLTGVLPEPQRSACAGAGETAQEAVMRGLQACLAETLGSYVAARKPYVHRLRLGKVEDVRCRYYLQALTFLQGEPLIALGEDVSGFRSVWVGTRDCWYGGIGLNLTLSLRRALHSALLKVQNGPACRAANVLEAASVHIGNEAPVTLPIPSSETVHLQDLLRSSLQVLTRNGKHLEVIDLAVEPLLKDLPGRVFGVIVREGDAG